MTAHSNVSREQRAALGRLGGLIGGKARAAKYTSEQLRQIHANQLNARFARMTPEQAHEFQRKAAQGRWGATADERSRIARELNDRRWGQVAYAKNQAEADRLYAFLREYISAKRCAPTMREMWYAMRRDRRSVNRLLQILERIGRIQRHAWGRGITLSQLDAHTPAVALSFRGELALQGSEAIVVPRPTKKCYQCDGSAVAGKTLCEQHLARAREASNRSHAKKRAAGRCLQCSALAVGKTFCERHLVLHRESRKRSRAKKRTAVRKELRHVGDGVPSLAVVSPKVLIDAAFAPG
jgi:hypothetical protein